MFRLSGVGGFSFSTHYSNSNPTVFQLRINLMSVNLYPLFLFMFGNGLQYDQWRNAGDIPVNRYKTLSGADAFKLPPRPTLVILLVEPTGTENAVCSTYTA